jgi:hypothetical protein
MRAVRAGATASAPPGGETAEKPVLALLMSPNCPNAV